jgi:hypothetical protein
MEKKQLFSVLLAAAENNRREPQSERFSTLPLNTGALVDYGECMAAVTLASQHLAEAIPSRQHNRTACALAALRIATNRLEEWLRAAGVTYDSEKHYADKK